MVLRVLLATMCMLNQCSLYQMENKWRGIKISGMPSNLRTDSIVRGGE